MDPETARALLDQAAAVYRDVRDPGVAGVFLYTSAAVEADLGQVESAVQHASKAVQFTEALGLQVWPSVIHELEAWLAAARGQLGDAAFERAWTAGRTANQSSTLLDVFAPEQV
jgi:hypothetical protein